MTALHIAALAPLAFALLAAAVCTDRPRVAGLALAGVALTVATVPALAQDTKITLGDALSPWSEMLGGALSVLVTGVIGWLAAIFKRWTGIQIEQAHMNTLQTAITNGAGQLILALGPKLGTVGIDVKSQAVHDAVLYVLQAAPDAVKSFGLSPEVIAQKIVAKLGVLTAANPATNPVAA